MSTAPRYHAHRGAIRGRNLDGFFNRPLYIANTHAFVLAGDRPIVRFASGETLHGTFLLGIVRAGRLHWLHEQSAIEAEYRPAHFRWTVRPSALAGVEVLFEIVALARPVGFAAQLRMTGARAGDELLWAFGGAKTWPGQSLNWALDPHNGTVLLPQPFDAALCAGNHVRATRTGFTVAEQRTARFLTHGQWTASATPFIAEAGDLANGLAHPASGRPRHPLLAARVPLTADFDATWSWLRTRPRTRAKAATPARLFTTGLARSAALAARISVETPDERLNALSGALGAAIDGAWYPPAFRHGAMLWNRRYPGWRTVFGGTVAGWPERVRAQAAFYFARQVKDDRNRSRRADPAMLLSVPARDSRFYGRGRILPDQAVYNMQSQLFDQMIHAWRWTGDAKLEALLRPALELHLEWIRACFDPDNDGLYESVINVWPTDSVWYAGGGATEETSYAYRAHTAARDLARRAGDKPVTHRHERTLTRIRTAFQSRLWSRARGHPGLYREQGGRQRLHEDAWLYSIFLPIDAGLVDTTQAAQSLRYTEWALQNDPVPAGGRRVWTSNFVPGIWSVRENWPGDNHHLALAYFQTGLARDGWEIFRGNFLHTAFAGRIPGDFGATAGGTDFGDCTCTFARTLVEGLFGYAPDYPNDVVKIAPQFPESWDHAKLHTPDVRLHFQRRNGELTLAVRLTRPAPLEIRLSLCARAITAVTADDRPATWQARPGFGCTLVEVRLPATGEVVVKVAFTGEAPVFPAQLRTLRPGDAVTLHAPRAVITDCSDPQAALTGARIRAGRLSARVGRHAGHHTVFARVTFGTLPQWRRFHLHVKPPRPILPRPIPRRATWACLDLKPVLNGDIRTIFQQAYLSPRPATVSARIGVDGYSPWTFPYWQSRPPAIALDGVPALLEPGDTPRLRTPQGVPFAWSGVGHNIAFTSLWDNWPDRVTVPVNRRGAAIWFLVCGSTNPMQGRIANGVLRLRYADGLTDELNLVPPFNYWNLCPIRVANLAPGQESRADYTAKTDAFCLPATPPPTVQLGENCRAMLLHQPLRPGALLRDLTLETLSSEVVIGLMGVTLMDR